MNTSRVGGQRNMALASGALIAALALGTVLRLLVNVNEYLWYDEVLSGTIAIQNWSGALESFRNDANAPLYFLTLWSWSQVFGVSNIALRAPGILVAIATPFVTWLLLHKRMPKDQCWLLTILVALWIPGLYYAQEARTYAYVIFGAALQTAFFYRAIKRKGDRVEIACWALSGLFLALTHYTTLVLSAVQGLTLLILFWRTRPLTIILAGLAYAPAALSYLSHREAFNRIATFEYPWLKQADLMELARAAAFLAGHKYILLPLLGTIAAAIIGEAVFVRTAKPKDSAVSPSITHVWAARLRNAFQSPLFLAGAASVIALLIYAAISITRPIFIDRYTASMAPGLFMGLIWLLSSMPKPIYRWTKWITVGFFFAGALFWAAAGVSRVDKRLTWEQESDILMRVGVSEALVFLDHGMPTPYDDDFQTKVLSFFFIRDGARARAREFVPDYTSGTWPDPRPQLSAFLEAKPNRGIIWTGWMLRGDLVSSETGLSKEQKIRRFGFSTVFDPRELAQIDGVTCELIDTGSEGYGKYVCYSSKD